MRANDILDALETALKTIGFNPGNLEMELTLSEYGERMRASFILPGYDFQPGDNNPIILKVNCKNSVDKSTALEINLSWYRLVCSNGMMYGMKDTKFRRIHLKSLESEEIDTILTEQLDRFPEEKSLYKQWFQTKVSQSQIEHWIDEIVAKKWGPHAAARAFHIAKTGCDGEVALGEKRVKAHKHQVKSTRRVPGSYAPVKNAFHISQVLSWLAKERKTVQDQLEWMMQIPYLMEELLSRKQTEQLKLILPQ